MFYTTSNISVSPSNCVTLSSDGNSISIDLDTLAGGIAVARITGGEAKGTTLAVATPIEAEITYNVEDMEKKTNQDIVATINFKNKDRDVTITNNDGKNTYTFTQNGEFTFEYTDEYGFDGTETAVVNNIDKVAPVITGVQNGQTYKKSVTPAIQDDSKVTVTLTKDGSAVSNYQVGDEIKEVGQYVLTATDEVENTTTVSFEIEAVSDVITSKEEVTVVEDETVIKDINPKTTVSALIQKLNAEMEYTIVDKDGFQVSDTTNVGTGCKIKMENDKTYTLIVKGDCNGDGEAELKDILAINKHRLNKTKLTAEYLQAADVTGDGKVELRDILQINKFRLGKISSL